MSYVEEEFHERQNSKDCSVHSLNNAMGFVVVKPEEVSEQIAKRVRAFSSIVDYNSDAVKSYQSGLSDPDDTFFSAESVWYAAAALGRCYVPKQIEDEMVYETHSKHHKDSLIFLGEGIDGAYHAVGCRNGRIYDSLNDGPSVELTKANIGKIYRKVLGVFCLTHYDS